MFPDFFILIIVFMNMDAIYVFVLFLCKSLDMVFIEIILHLGHFYRLQTASRSLDSEKAINENYK